VCGKSKGSAPASASAVWGYHDSSFSALYPSGSLLSPSFLVLLSFAPPALSGRRAGGTPVPTPSWSSNLSLSLSDVRVTLSRPREQPGCPRLPAYSLSSPWPLQPWGTGTLGH